MNPNSVSTTRTARGQPKHPEDNPNGPTAARRDEREGGYPILLTLGNIWARSFLSFFFFCMYFEPGFMYLGTKEGLLPSWEINTFIFNLYVIL